MLAPVWFQKELTYIEPDYFAVWNGRNHRWEIRRWIKPHLNRDLFTYEDASKKSILIMHVCYRDDIGRDVGYHPLDMRVLYSLKRAKKFTDRPVEKILKEIDDHNKEIEMKYDQEREEIIRDAAKIAWNAMRRVWSK